MTIGKQIAKEILSQLGGNKFIVMTGAKQMSHDDKGTLCFKIGRNKTQVNHVKVEYDNGLDLYNMTFSYMAKGNFFTKKKYEGVMCDQLKELFTEYTGLYTSLGTMGRAL